MREWNKEDKKQETKALIYDFLNQMPSYITNLTGISKELKMSLV